jgi:hypothetical protein
LIALAEQPGVIALSFHVDYWNDLGYRDPFSAAAHSGRQRRYARAFDGRVYTPQLVINGREELLGSDRDGARAAIGRALSVPAVLDVRVKLERGGARRLSLACELSANPSARC